MKKLYVLFISLIFLPFNIYALEKQETVYSSLSSNGEVKNVVVVNHLKNPDVGDIEDYSELDKIVNLNGNEKYTFNNNTLLWKSSGNDIFYRGEINKVLPLQTKITYYLDGKLVDLKDLIGKKGNVSIKINLRNSLKNNVRIYGKNETIYTPFVVTSVMPLDENYSNISVSHGKVVSNGNRNYVVGIASPGLSESLNLDDNFDNITVSFYTKNFNLGNIYLLSTPKFTDSLDVDVFDKAKELTSGITSIKTNMDTIEEKIGLLYDGAGKLDNGLKLMLQKLDKAKESLSKLKSNSTLLNTNVDNIIEELETQKSNLDISKYSKEIESLKTLKSNNTKYIEILSKDENNKSLVELLKANNNSIDRTLNIFNEISMEVNATINKLELVIKNLKVATTKFDAGIDEFILNMDELGTKVNTLVDGISSINEGSLKLKMGISEINNKGINKLYNYSNLISSYSNKAEAMVALSNKYKGYSTNNASKTFFVSVVNIK